MLCFLFGPTLTSVQNYWKSHSFDYTNLCRQSDASALICCLLQSKSAYFSKYTLKSHTKSHKFFQSFASWMIKHPFYKNAWLLKMKLRNTVSFKVKPKRIKYLRTNLSRSSRPFSKQQNIAEIKFRRPKINEKCFMFIHWKDQCCQVGNSPHFQVQIQHNPYQNTADVFLQKLISLP